MLAGEASVQSVKSLPDQALHFFVSFRKQFHLYPALSYNPSGKPCARSLFFPRGRQVSASAVSKVSAAGIRPASPRNGISRAYWCGRSWGESEGESEGFDGLLAFSPLQFHDSEPSNASSLTVHITPNQAGSLINV